MKHIKDYMKKIELILKDRSVHTKPDKKGLLSPTKTSTAEVDKTELSTVADFVYGIRMAHEELKNGK